MMRAHRSISVALTLAATLAHAQDAAPAISPHRHLDPGTPPLAVRQAAQAERAAARKAGAPALETRVEAQLRASFDAADVARQGTLTRAQAQAGGFGFVAQHFDAIDARRAGAVSFDDVKRYLQRRNARYLAK